jgi:hypothetical protein
MDRKQVDAFETLQAQMDGLYDEMQALAKKDPNDGVNKFKLKLINSLLKRANTLMGQAHLPLEEFKEFADESLPSNSDVVVVLSQYRSCLDKIRADNVRAVGFEEDNWRWIIDGEVSDVPAAPPRKLRK